MLIKNLGTNVEQWGSYSLNPGEWCYLPTRTALEAKLHENPGFECLSPSSEKKHTVFIFSGCPMGTTGGGQHPAQIARELARQGCQVFFITSGLPVGGEENLFVIQDRNLFKSEGASRDDYNKWHRTFLEFSQTKYKIALFTFPSAYLAEIAMMAALSGYQTAYWCLDDWAEINKAQNNTFDEECEKDLIHFCNTTIATAKVLAEKLQPWTKEPVEVISNGFSRQNFPEIQTIGRPADMQFGEKTLVYWGELQGRWLDFDLLEGIARQQPTWQINLIGPDRYVEKRIQLPNVHYLGEKSVSELYQYGAFANAGLIPFKQGAVSDSVNPIKAYEYLACNLPIISIPMPELDSFPYTFQVPGDAGLFCETIQCLPELSDIERQRVNNFLDKSTWAGRAAAFLNTMIGDSLDASNISRSA